MSVSFDETLVRRKRRRITRANVNSLPPEIIAQIMDSCGLLPYYTYRLLRCLPTFKGVIDSQYLVLTNMEQPSMFAIPKDQPVKKHFFKSFETCKRRIEKFVKTTNCKMSNLKIYIEFQEQSTKPHHKEDMFKRFLLYYSNNLFNFVAYPHQMSQQNLDSLDSIQLSREEDQPINTIVLYKESYLEIVSLIKIFKNLPSFRLELFAPPEYDKDTLISHYIGTRYYRDLFDLSRYVWKHKFDQLTKIECHGLEGGSLFKVIPNMIILNLKYIKLFGVSNKPENLKHIRGLRLPKLETLILIATYTSSFSNNKLPRLKELIIEESENIKTGLQFTKNDLSSLKSLSICSDAIESFHSNTLPDKLLHTRIDSSIKTISGNYENLNHIVNFSTSLVIATRNDPDMLRLLFEPLHELPFLVNLAIIHEGYIGLMEVLDKVEFPELKTLKIYESSEIEFKLSRNTLNKLESIYLLSTAIKTVYIRSGFNPQKFKEIIYDTSHNSKEITRRKYHIYGRNDRHLEGAEFGVSTNFHGSALDFMDHGDKYETLFQIKVTPEIYQKTGTINFEYFKASSVLSEPDRFHRAFSFLHGW